MTRQIREFAILQNIIGETSKIELLWWEKRDVANALILDCILNRKDITELILNKTKAENMPRAVIRELREKAKEQILATTKQRTKLSIKTS